MIQRIQTLYLLILTALLVILFFVPFARFTAGTEAYYIDIFGIYQADPDTQVVPGYHMTALLALSMLLPFVTIFLYKFRMLQMRLCIVEMVLLAGLQCYIFYYIFRTGNLMSGYDHFSRSYSIVDVIPLVGIYLSYLAYRGILRDVALLRSTDRIR